MASWWEEAAGALGEYYPYLGRFGLTAGAPWDRPQQYQASFFSPLLAAFRMGGAMAASPGYVGRTAYQAPVDWGTFMGPEGAPASSVSTLAGTQSQIALANLLRMYRSEREVAGLTFEGREGEEGMPAGALANLLEAALRGRMGRYGSQFVARQAERMAPQWAASTAMAEQQGISPASFLDYLKQRYGL